MANYPIVPIYILDIFINKEFNSDMSIRVNPDGSIDQEVRESIVARSCDFQIQAGHDNKGFARKRLDYLLKKGVRPYQEE